MAQSRLTIGLLKDTIPVEIRFDFFLIVIQKFYGIGNNVWKFQVSTMKIVPVECIWSLCIIRIIMTHHKGKGEKHLIISWWTCVK